MLGNDAKLIAAIAQANLILETLDPDDPKALIIKNLVSYTERNQRRLDRLTKRSDATEAKLFETNNMLETITTSLSRFVPQTVADALMNGGAEQVSKIDRRNLTVFFSDIVGFSTLASRQEPETVAQLLMEYFTVMSDICAKYGGTLDQFIGDAIVIFFGDPSSKGAKGDANAAVQMALDMQEKMHELRLKWRAEGLAKDLHVRMGISTGYCNVGNFGSFERLHYTAIGNAVNEAARIEALAPQDTVIISEDTNTLIKDQIETKSIGVKSLKGRDHPVELFQALALRQHAESSLIAFNEEGFRLYIDSKSIEDKAKVIKALNQALDNLKSKK